MERRPRMSVREFWEDMYGTVEAAILEAGGEPAPNSPPPGPLFYFDGMSADDVKRWRENATRRALRRAEARARAAEEESAASTCCSVAEHESPPGAVESPRRPEPASAASQDELKSSVVAGKSRLLQETGYALSQGGSEPSHASNGPQWQNTASATGHEEAKQPDSCRASSAGIVGAGRKCCEAPLPTVSSLHEQLPPRQQLQPAALPPSQLTPLPLSPTAAPPAAAAGAADGRTADFPNVSQQPTQISGTAVSQSLTKLPLPSQLVHVTAGGGSCGAGEDSLLSEYASLEQTPPSLASRPVGAAGRPSWGLQEEPPPLSAPPTSIGKRVRRSAGERAAARDELLRHLLDGAGAATALETDEFGAGDAVTAATATPSSAVMAATAPSTSFSWSAAAAGSFSLAEATAPSRGVPVLPVREALPAGVSQEEALRRLDARLERLAAAGAGCSYQARRLELARTVLTRCRVPAAVSAADTAAAGSGGGGGGDCKEHGNGWDRSGSGGHRSGSGICHDRAPRPAVIGVCKAAWDVVAYAVAS
ncbi:unnamed protein product [Phaeothamnion confervicola]